jgi:diacylglycerol O-acyltransferase
MRVQSPRVRLGPPRWVPSDAFDLDRHLTRHRVADWDAVLDLAREAAETGFDRTGPLWEFTLLDGLADGTACLLLKLHHSLTDGVGGMQLAAHVFDLDEDAPGGSEGLAAHLPRPSARGLAATPERPALRRRARSTWRVMRPVRTQLSPVFGERGLRREVAVLDVPLAGLHAAAKKAGGRVNDAFLAGLLGGLERYHRHHGTRLPTARVTMPVSLRTSQDGLGGNKITLLRIEMPSGHPDAAERIRGIAALVRRWRDEPALGYTQGIARTLNLLPRAYVGNMLKRMEVVASDVPGVPVPVWLAGARLTAFYSFGPTIGAALNVTLLSYAGTCHVGVNVDTGAVPDHEELVACLRQGFAEVVALAAPAAVPATES